MAIVIDRYSNSKKDHWTKWVTFNSHLHEHGYKVIYQHNHLKWRNEYAITKDGTTIGIYDDEATAEAMVKLILTNVRDEE
jgi:hypothetical protein